MKDRKLKNLLISDGTPFAKISKYLILALPLCWVGVTMDNDFWFTINHGRYILEHGFTNIEPFTVHEGLAFSFEKWLTCITFYKIYDWFGTWGMYVFILLVFCVIIWLFYKVCLLFSGNSQNISLLITSINMCFFGINYIRTRPQIFSYVFMLAELYCLEKYAQTGNIKKLYPLPLLSFLYMQFHSTMLPIFFIIMLPYICDFGWFKVLGIGGSKYKKWPLLAAFAACALTSLINPYGVRSFVYLINSLNDGGLLSNINEVKRSSFNDIIGCCGAVLAFRLAAIAARIGRKETYPLRHFLMSLGTFAMALYAVRNNAFYILMGGAVAAYQLKSIGTGYNIMPVLKKIAGIAVIASIIYTAVYPYDIMRSTYAWKALDAFKAMHPDTNVTMYTDFNCGSYAEWMGFKCYADPRAEVFLKSVNGKEDILAEVWDSMHRRITAQELQEKYDFDYWLVQSDYSLDYQIRNKSDYKLLVEEDGYKVYEHIK